jgi:DNA-binding CsgD family transcriptional regulator
MREHMGAVSDHPVGRDDELASLGEMLDQVAAATSTVRVVTGDAGMGKSALLDWTVAEARRRGFTVLRATGIEFEQVLAFSGLTAVLRPLLDRIDALAPGHAKALRGALGHEDADTGMLAVHGATLALVAAAAEDAPVLVAVDDAQWIDQSSLESLVFAAHRCEADRVGFLFAQRSGTRCLLDRTEFERMALGGLVEDAAVGLLVTTGVDESVAARCWELTRGNPLALTEAGRGLSPGQRTGDEPLPPVLPIGDRLVDSFRAQISALPPATVQALATAAYEADDDPAQVATALAPLGGKLDDLCPAESAGLVTLTDGRITWRHPLCRAAVLHLIDAGRRRQIHRSLAEAASAAGHHERALWHLSESVIGPDDSVATRMADLGAVAQRRGSLAAAASAYEQAARLTTDPAARAQHLTAAALACYAAGDHLRASAALAPVVDEVTDPYQRAVMAAVLGQAELWLEGPAAATPRFEVTARSIRATHPEAASMLLMNSSVSRLVALDMAGAQAASREAAEAAAEAGDAGLQLLAAAQVALLDLFAGVRSNDALDTIAPLGRQALAAYEPGVTALDQIEGIVHASASIYLVCGDAATAAEMVRQLIHISNAVGLAGRSLYSRLVLVEALFRLGWWAEALAEASQLISMQQASGLGHLVPMSYAVLTKVEAGLGHDEACREHAEAAVAYALKLGVPQIAVYAVTGIGLLEMGAGRYAKAAEEFDRITGANVAAEPGWLWWQGDAIEAFARAGRTTEAHGQLDVLEAQAATSGNSWARAAAERCGAILGRGAPAEERFAAALDGFRSIRAEFEVARTLLVRGEHRLREGNDAEGARDLATARTMFDRMGARPWSDRASAARGEVAGGERSLASRLTEAELRVALAVGNGLSNRQAAEKLFLSVKTVDFHLQGIYRKLGVRNRTQLAAIVLSGAGGGGIAAGTGADPAPALAR